MSTETALLPDARDGAGGMPPRSFSWQACLCPVGLSGPRSRRAPVVLSGWMLYGQYTNLFWAGAHPVRDAVAAELEHADVACAGISGRADSLGRHAGPLKVDLFSQYVRWLVLVMALVLVLMSLQLAPGRASAGISRHAIVGRGRHDDRGLGPGVRAIVRRLWS